MPLPNTRRQQKRASNATSRLSKRLQTGRGTASQLIEVDATYSQITFRASQYEALAAATSQATNITRVDSSPPLSIQDTAVVALIDATDVATAFIDNPPAGETLDDTDRRFADNFDGINWDALPLYRKHQRTLKHKKSWVFDHGYRVALLSQLDRTFWVCRYCHIHRVVGSKYIFEVSKSTSIVLSHLALSRPGHNFSRNGAEAGPVVPPGQKTLQFLRQQGVDIDQAIVNEIGNFNVQAFRYAAVTWLVDNNHPLREFETPAFKQMIAYANPEAAAALWMSHRSVSAYVLRLYHSLYPRVTATLSEATSRIHISFDGWSTKGGK